MLSALPDYLYSVGMYSKHSRDAHRQKIEEGLAKPNHNPFYPEDKDGYVRAHFSKSALYISWFETWIQLSIDYLYADKLEFLVKSLVW